MPATCWAAMAPPAPGRLMTTIGVGKWRDAASAAARAARSAPPPGAKPTMSWMGRVGSHALAVPAVVAAASPAVAAIMVLRVSILSFLLVGIVGATLGGIVPR